MGQERGPQRSLPFLRGQKESIKSVSFKQYLIISEPPNFFFFRTYAERLIKCAPFWAKLYRRSNCRCWWNTCTLTTSPRTNPSTWNFSRKKDSPIAAGISSAKVSQLAANEIRIHQTVTKLNLQVKRATGRIISAPNWIAVWMNGLKRTSKELIWSSQWNWINKTNQQQFCCHQMHFEMEIKVLWSTNYSTIQTSTAHAHCAYLLRVNPTL